MEVIKKVKSEEYRNLFQRGLLLLLYIQFIPLLIVAQSGDTQNSITTLLDSAQKIYGNSDLLVNGAVYYQPNRLASGTPYLYSQEVEKGVIYTRGITFNDVNLNYNIVSQKLLLLNITTDESRLLIDLSNILVDSFLIKDYLFVSTANLHVKSKLPYLMAINSNKYSMYVGFKKEFIAQFDEKYPFGRHSKIKRTLFLISDSNSVRINSIKSLLKTFPSARKELSEYFRQHDIDLAEATPEELKQLMEFYNYQKRLANE